ncbi:MAG: hypothetical protein GXP47_02040 [Acidobacteria bacterium]|nr:hypothetical protein [Acidobacteriota bacterium]
MTTHHTIRIHRLAVAAIVLVLAAVPAVAQNLVVNGTFDHDISGWTTQDPSVKMLYRSDLGNTLAGGSGPGAMEVQHLAWNGGGSGPLQLIPVTAGNTYTVSGAVFVPDSTDNLIDYALITLTWYDEANFVLDRQEVAATSERGVWNAGSDDLVAPPGTAKAEVRAVVFTRNAENETRPSVAYFDDIAFAEAGAAGARQVLFVPASASAHGFNGTFWTTTGWFSSKVSVPVEIRAAFLRQGQSNLSAPGNLSHLGTIPANGFLEIQDMAAKLGGAGLSGGIYIEATAQGTGLPAELVGATTYTFTPNDKGPGGYGQGVPAVPVGVKTEVSIPGVYQGEDYRTNIGLVNTSGANIEIDVRILARDGSTLAAAEWALKPYEQKQVSVTGMGVASTNGGSVTFSRVGSTGSFQAYATVVDQSTGDAVYTPGL